LFLVIAGAQQSAIAQAVRTNSGFNTTSVPRNDDGSYPDAVPLGFTANFFGVSDTAVFVNNNGNVTFGGPLATFTPQGLTASPLRIIAPYWADVDTRGEGSALVTFGRDTVNGRPAFGVNWVNVGYFASHDNLLNSFQLVLIDRSDIRPGDFDIEFNYDRIVWETGDASGGSGGFGGTSASAGYSNGEGKPEGSFEILGSRVNGLFLDSNRNGLIYRRLNSGVRGRLVFFVRSGAVSCSYASLSIEEPFPWQGGNGAIQVAAPGTCEWTAVSNSGFITINGESTRRGSGTVEYTVAENRSRARSGTIIVAGDTITVTQDGFITLKVTPPAVNVSAVDGVLPVSVALQVEALRDPVEWAASVRLLDANAGWRLRLSPEVGTATEATPSSLVLELENGFLTPLPAMATIIVRDVVNGPIVEVPVMLGMSQLGPRVQLSQSAFVFHVAQGGAAPPPQTLLVLNSGVGVLSWSIPTGEISSAPWLSLSATSGQAIAGPTIPSSTILTVNPAGLAVGAYQAMVPVSAPGALNNPQSVSVTLHVVPASAAPTADVSPKSMVFLWQQGRPQPQPQSLMVSNLGSGSLTFGLAPASDFGAALLGISPTSGNATGGPATAQVSLNPTALVTLAPGLYRETIAAEFSAGAAQEVQVLLVVTPPAGNPLQGGNTCFAETMDMAVSTVGNGARFSVSFPVPLVARLIDSCGRALNDASVFVDIQGTTITLQPLGDGRYSGTWTPALATDSVTLDFHALHTRYADVQQSFVVSAAAAPGDLTLPTISTDGVVEAAGLTPSWPLAPGGIIAVFGSGFASQAASATAVPLPRTLGGVSLRIGGEDAPLYYVGPNQINAQVPYSARPGDSVAIIVNSNGRLSSPQNYLIVPVRPGLFTAPDGSAAALDAQSQPVTAQNPARVRDVLQLYAAGLGLVEPPAQTGEAAPALSTVHNPVTVTIGGVQVPILYQGLVPGFVGLYQLNVGVVPSIPSGDAVPVVIEQNGIESNPGLAVTIPVRRPGE
jgi:uncharacterized protein (TIGR03437 family)